MNRRAFLRTAVAASFLHQEAWAGPAGADLIGQAPTLGIVVDDSSDAPAWVPGIMKSAARDCREIIGALPMASTVFIMVASDPLAHVPEILRTRVQARTTPRGTTSAQLAAQVEHFLLEEFPKRTKPDNKAGSSIIAALRDANRLLNPNAAAPNRLYLITDGLERSALADCYRDCRLPQPDFRFPPQTRIEAIGWGLRLPDRQSIALWKPWQQWFKDAGAELMLYRTR